MPEHLRSFVAISVLMALAYLISKRLFASAVEPGFVERLYGTGFAATAIMFWAHNMWLFLGGLALVSVIAARRFSHPLALFLFLMLLIPGFSVQVPGFGLINYLINLNAWRILSLSLLLLAALQLSRCPSVPRPGSLFADKIVIAYTLYITFLSYVHHETFTGALRQLSETTLDFVLLYFVASRALIIKDALRHAMVALVMAAIFLALVGGFEFGKRWLLYSYVDVALGAMSSDAIDYLFRGETLRARATTGQAIVFGFVMMVATLLCIYVQRLVQPGILRALLWLIMAMGLIAAMSRGPWVGAAIGLFVAAMASANPFGNLFKLVIASIGVAILLLLLPGGEKIMSYLPWVGSVDAGSVTYREMMWTQSLLVIDKHPWIGSMGFITDPAFDVVRFSSGFVDILSGYLQISLETGFIGLGLYCLLLVSAIAPNLKNVINKNTQATESSLFLTAWVSAILASLVTISTVSTIDRISLFITLLVGAGVATAWMEKRSN